MDRCAALERKLAEIAGRVLSVPAGQVDLQASFRDLGFDSLRGLRFLDAANRLLGLRLGMGALAEHGSIRELCLHVAASQPAAPAGDRGVAIIGMSGRFAGARNLGELWRNLCLGVDSVVEVPPERWDVDRHYHPDPGQPGRSHSKWAGFVDGVDEFDPRFFGIPPAEAQVMDPQQRLFLQECWSALEDAGCTPGSLDGVRCGVYAGVVAHEYAGLLEGRINSVQLAQSMTGTSHAILAARIAYFLNLKGPAISLDTACSSSLVAVHLACRALEQGDADLMLAGGVTTYLSEKGFVLMSKVGMLSPRGKCRAFDDGADGIALGEGAGVVVLKPLDRALRDGDRIHAVIRASGMNQDGRTNGITAPSAASQTDLLLRVYAEGEIDPETITLVEAHGTGTKLGDPIELAALTEAFRRHTGKAGFCALGSVKGNIGHTSGAAGIASLLKTVLALRNGLIPPTLHVERVNGDCDLDGSPFFLNRELREWEPGPAGRRRAAVSSFGFSGTNCHVVVDEAPEAPPRPGSRRPFYAVCLSARGQEALRQRIHDLSQWLSGEGASARLEDVSYTLSARREAFKVRLAPVVASLAELWEQLEGLLRSWDGGGAEPPKGRRKRDPLFEQLARNLAAELAGPDLAPAERRDKLAALADLWVRGHDVDWEPLYQEDGSALVSLPAYPFARARYGPPGVEEPPGGHHPLSFWQPAWVERPAAPGVGAPDGAVLVVCARGGARLAEALASRHARVGRVPLEDPGALESCLSELVGVGTVYFLGGLDAGEVDVEDLAELERSQERGVVSLFRLIKALVRHGYGPKRLHLKVVTCGVHAVEPAESVRPCGASLDGLSRSAAREYPAWQVARIDLPLGVDLPSLAAALASEPGEPAGAEVALRGEKRWVRRLAPAALPPAVELPLRSRGVYLLLGGAGGLGLELARHLIERVQARLVLLGRGELNERRRQALADLEARGGEVLYLRADASDPASLESAVAQARQRFGPIHGVVHSALVLRDRSLENMDEATLRAALAPKVLGSAALWRAVRGEPLDLVLFFSSAQSFAGNAGQGNYAAACTFKDAFAHWLRGRVPARVQIVNWGYWGSVGVVATAEHQRRLKELGVSSIDPREGMEALDRVLASGLGQVVAIKAEDRLLQRLGAEIPADTAAPLDATVESVGLWLAGLPSVPAFRRTADELDRFGRLLLLAAFQGAGLFRHAGERHAERQLERRLEVVPGYSRLLAESLAILQRAGFLLRRGGEVEVTLAAEEAGAGLGEAALQRHYEELAATLPEAETYAALLRRCVPRLLDVLSGRAAATEVLFPGSSMDLVTSVHRDNAIAGHYAGVVARSLVGFLEARRGSRLRVLEVGAGVGGTSRAVLEALQPYAEFVEYLYTDVSPAFLRFGEREYGARHSFVRFGLFDVERGVETQGYTLQSFDAVVACNVLHATRGIRAAVRNVKSLLRPGGWLLLSEATDPRDFSTLTFGLTRGWWHPEDMDDRASGAPLLSLPAWERLLREEGFACIGVPGRSGDPAAESPQHVVLAESDGRIVPPATEEVRPSVAAPRTAPEPEGGVEQAAHRRRIQSAIVASLSQVLGVPEKELDAETSYVDYGLDSILAIEVTRRINQDLGTELAPTELYNHPNVRALADHVAGLRLPKLPEEKAPEIRVAGEERPAPPEAERGPGGDIAVIGMAAQFPAARNVRELWRNLKAGRDSVREVPPFRWDLDEVFDPDPRAPNKTYSRWGGFLAGFDRFDPVFFGIGAREAEWMDPQQRLFLQEAWRALEDAGYSGRDLAGARCGVFAGCREGDYQHGLLNEELDSWYLMGNNSSILAARLAYFLDLKGPGVAVDTACSSALVAVHLACESLRSGSSEIALAGGVCVLWSPLAHVALSRTGMLSPQGRCRTFDRGADGFVPGEGVGVVVLKPLRAALADGDHVYGVIRGSEINQDGRTNGITAPSAPSQTALECRVYDRFGIDPATLSYVEAHGTGTKLGDPIEIQALTEAFRRYTPARGFCAIGSVKTNIGHSLAAAGVAGLIKVLCCLERRTLVPSLHFRTANETIDFESSPFWVNTETREWTHDPAAPRRAAVSSFGFSGTNAHLVVEEAPVRRNEPAARPKTCCWIALSAKDPAALARRVEDLRLWADGDEGGQRLEDVAYTLHTGRTHLPVRAGWVVRDWEDLRDQLAEAAAMPPAALAEDEDPEDLRRRSSALLRERPGSLDPEEHRRWLLELDALYRRGADFDWNALYPGGGHRLPLPGYPFAGEGYWVSPLADSYYEPVWQEAPAGSPGGTGVPADLVVLAAGDAVARRLREVPGGSGRRVALVRPGDRFRQVGDDAYEVDPRSAPSWRDLWRRLRETGLRPDRVAHLWALPEGGAGEEVSPDGADERLWRGLLSILQALRTAGEDRGFAGRFLFLHGGAAGPDPFGEAVGGVVKSLGRVLPGVSLRTVEVARGAADAEALAALIDRELDWGEEAEVRYADGRRQVRGFRKLRMDRRAALAPRRGGLYLVTGGAGALGLLFARWLAERWEAQVALVGRSEPAGEVLDRLRALPGFGDAVVYHRGDVADRGDLERVLRRIAADHGPLRGILHAAGRMSDRVLTRKDMAGVEEILRPKVQGTLVLDELTRDEPLDFFVAFSSLSSLLGDFGQCDYAAANRFLDAFAQHRERLRERGLRRGRSLSIAWPLWKRGGMHLPGEGESLYLATSGLGALDTAWGLRAFEEILATGPCRVGVFPGESRRRIAEILDAAASGPEPAVAIPTPPPAAPAVLAREERQRLREALRELAADILNLPSSRLPFKENLGNLGFDSINLKTLSARLSGSYGADIPPSVFFAHGSIEELVTYLCEEHPAETARYLAGHGGTPVPPRELPGEAAPVERPAAGPSRPSDVAIIGIHGVFPGSPDLASYWDHLAAGRSLITEIPPERWDWRTYGGDRLDAARRIRWGGFIAGVDRFDARFFNVSPLEAQMMDPQHRLFLETVWKAIEDGGYRASALAGRPVGVFVGIQFNDYEWLLSTRGGAAAQKATGNAQAMVANRVSYVFDFRGPSESIDTACSSGLVAIHRAVRSLRSGESELAVAGAVSLMLSPETWLAACELGILSPEGKCKTFDRSADGYVRGEGVAALLLKRLKDARRDGDPIYAVIKGTAENHGGRATSLTAPSSEAQAALLARAWEEAGFDPGSITYVEAHGTGTELGDPVEVDGIKNAFRRLAALRGEPLPAGGSCGLGAVKTNIGHLEPAAGLAGVAKVVLAMRHGILPATLNHRELNPYIDLRGTPLYVVDSARPWERPREGRLPRRAGVSAFGFGGSNAHVALEEHVVCEPEVPEQAGGVPCLLVLSARTEERLRAQARQMRDFAADRGRLSVWSRGRACRLADVAYTLQVAREPMEARLAVIAGSFETWVDRLTAYLDGAPEPEGVFLGHAGEAAGPLADLVQGEAGEAFLAAALRAGELAKLARLWVAGADLDWTLLSRGEALRRIPLPTYPFARDRHWIEAAREEAAPAGSPPAFFDAVLAEAGRRTAALGAVPSFGPAVGEVERFGRRLLLHGFQSLGAFRATGERHTAAGLRQRLGVAPGYERLLDASLEILIRAGVLRAEGGEVVVAAAGDPGGPKRLAGDAVGLAASFPEAKPYLDLLLACGLAWPDVVTGRRHAAEVLFPGGSMALVEGVYAGNPAGEHYNRAAAAAVSTWVEELLRRDPRARPTLLEVGAGTGSVSRFVLEALRPWGDRLRYLFTDVSPRFVREAADRYGALHPFVEFRILDLERDFGPQGIEPGSVDLVLGCNVLHATRTIAATLERIGGALRDGGLLAVLETTRLDELSTLTFGLTGGWWLFEDARERIPGSPLLSAPQWLRSLEAAGFGARPVELPGNAPRLPEESLFLAERRVPSTPAAVRPAPALEAALEAEAREYVRGVLAQTLRMEPSEIGPGVHFDAYGLDSLVVQQVNRALEGDLGELPASLLFQYTTVSSLASYLVEHRRDRLAQLCGAAAAAEVLPAPEPVVARPFVHTSGGAEEGIAVIGLAGRYPGSESVDELWRHLRRGASCITEVPPDRWDWREHFDPGRGDGKSYSKWGGFIADADKFDSLFFNISPKEAETMDPQERVFLETAWAALEDAGYTRRALVEQGADVGVFVGVMNCGYEWAGSEAAARGRRTGAHAAYWSIANRVSYLFDFQGPSLAVDTACSASLTAIHLACESLRRGECRAALAGGVNLILHPVQYWRLCKVGMLAADDRCKPFRDAADGFVDGEGVGAVLMKPLAAALRDGDSIHGVILGSSINSGGRTHGYTVPNPNAQRDVVLGALRRAGVDPRTLSYVEAHGTGTALGDPIEIAGLAEAFAASTPDRRFCAIGSIKSNIGHLESAAGVAGLTKVLLQMRHRELVPSLHALPLNRGIDFAVTPFRVQTALAEWRRPLLEDGMEHPRRAGVSSFGAGGANAHVIVEEHVDLRPVEEDGSPQIAVLSARTPEVLRAAAKRLLAFLDGREREDRLPLPALPDIVYTLQVGREALEERLAVVVRTREELASALGRFLDGAGREAGLIRGTVRRSGREAPQEGGPDLEPTAELWAGGAAIDWQRLHPGRVPRRVSLPTYPFARERHWAGEVQGGEHAGGGREALLRTLRVTDPVLRDHRVRGTHVLPGVAHLQMVHEAASNLWPGRRVDLRRVVWLQPLQVQEEERVQIVLEDKGDRIRFEIRGDGSGNGPGEPALYSQGELHPVGGEAVLEDRRSLMAIRERCGRGIGAEELYRGFAEAGLDYGEGYRTVVGIRAGDGEALGELQLLADPGAGLALDPGLLDGALQVTAGLMRPGSPLRLPYAVESFEVFRPLPAHGFAHVESRGPGRIDVALLDEMGVVCARFREVASREPKDRWSRFFHVPAWRVAAPPEPAGNGTGRVLIVHARGGEGLAGALESIHAGEGAARIELGVVAHRWAEGWWEVPLEDPQSLERYVSELDGIGTVYFLGGLDAGEADVEDLSELERSQERGVLSLFRLIKALVRHGYGPKRLHLKVVTCGVHAVEPGEDVRPCGASLDGLSRSAAREYPAWQVARIDLPIDPMSGSDLPSLAAALASEPGEPAGAEVALRRERRWVRRLKPVTLAPAGELPLRSQGVYLILGGAGGLGLELARHLVERVQARLVLLGRGELDERRRQALADLETRGGEVLYLRADASDPASLESAVAQARQRFGPIHGVVHSALVLRDRSLENMDEATLRAALAPKVLGSVALWRAVRGEPLELVLFFSSAQSFAGNAGQGNYAAACTFKDAFAHWLRGRVPARVQIVNWGYWGSVGVVATAEHQRRLADLGVSSIEPREGMEALDRILASGLGQVVAIKAEDRLLQRLGAETPTDTAAPLEPLETPETSSLSEIPGTLAEALEELAAELPATLADALREMEEVA